MFRAGQLNLEPGFQRKSAWGWTDRRWLVQTLAEHCPVPSIFLYERREDGSVVYDVIDGKQRIETILMFLAEGRFKQHCGIKTPERSAFYLDFVAASLFSRVSRRFSCASA
jgi:hypothetical protein